MLIDQGRFKREVLEKALRIDKIVRETDSVDLEYSIEFKLAGREFQEYCHQFGVSVHIVLLKDKKLTFVFYPLDQSLKETESEIQSFILSQGILNSPN